MAVEVKGRDMERERQKGTEKGGKELSICMAGNRQRHRGERKIKEKKENKE